jgi:ABC-type bacteriocin/lantibiotic exporter with double-glycine peptidase domain
VKKFKAKTLVQHEEMDCGAAAITGLLNSYGIPAQMWDLKRYIKASQDGVTFANLCEVLISMEFQVELYMIEDIEDLESINEPILTALNKGDENELNQGTNHFVILKKLKGTASKFYLMDPSWGTVKINGQNIFPRLIKEIAIITPPKSNMVTLDRKVFSLGRIFELINLKKIDFVIITFIAALMALLGIFPAIIFGYLIDSFSSAIGSGIRSETYQILAVILVVMMFQDFLNYYSERVSFSMSTKLEYRFGRSLMKRILSLRMMSFVARRTSDYYSFFENSFEFLNWVTETYSSLLIRIFSFLFILTGIGAVSLQLCLLASAFTIIVGVVSYYLAKKKEQVIYTGNILSGRSSSQFADILSYYKMIKVCRAESFMFKKWFRTVIASTKLAYYTHKIMLNYTTFSQLVRSLSLCVILYKGTDLVLNNEITIGQLMIVWGLTNNLILSVLSLESLISVTVSSKIGFYRYLGLVAEIEDDRMKAGASILANKQSEEVIALNNVSFTYPTRANVQVLKNVDMSILRGQVTGIAGASGSGKSTVLGILSDLYSPSLGEYKFYVDPKSVLLVDQDIRLFSGKIIDNLLIAPQRINLKQLDYYLEEFGLADTINANEIGINAHINDINRNLSGGEVQRFLIVRALMHNPEVLVLDEPTSSLDQATERNILNSILNWVKRENKTLIFASHRLQMFELAEQVYTFKDGKIVEKGTYAELTNSNSEFSRLFTGVYND